MDIQMMQLMQEQIEKLLRLTQRENVENLIEFLRTHGYYSARCHNHHRFEGGTSQHSVETLLYMQQNNHNHLPLASVVIVALLHDICNIPGFNDVRHHGSRSVIITVNHAKFPLTKDEYQAILWHMHGKEEKGLLGHQFDEVLNNPLWNLLRRGDHHSSHFPQTRYELRKALLEGPSARRVQRASGASRMIVGSNAPHVSNEITHYCSFTDKLQTATDSAHKTSPKTHHDWNINDIIGVLEVNGLDPLMVHEKLNKHYTAEEIWPRFIKEEGKNAETRNRIKNAVGKSANLTNIVLKALEKEDKVNFNSYYDLQSVYNDLDMFIDKPKFRFHTFQNQATLSTLGKRGR